MGGTSAQILAGTDIPAVHRLAYGFSLSRLASNLILSSYNVNKSKCLIMGLRKKLTPDSSAWWSPALLILFASANLAASAPSFDSAKPIWPKGRETEKNLFVGFRASFKTPAQERVILRATGATLYRVFLNGHFLGEGPARGPHGFYRVDEWELTAKLQPGVNVVAFEVAGYNVNSYYLLDQPSFLQAEIVADGKVLASTDGHGAPFTPRFSKSGCRRFSAIAFSAPSRRCIGSLPGTTGGGWTQLRPRSRLNVRPAGESPAVPPR